MPKLNTTTYYHRIHEETERGYVVDLSDGALVVRLHVVVDKTNPTALEEDVTSRFVHHHWKDTNLFPPSCQPVVKIDDTWKTATVSWY